MWGETMQADKPVGEGTAEREPISRRDLITTSAKTTLAGGVLRLAAAAGVGAVASQAFAAAAAAQQPGGKSRLYDVLDRKTLVVGTGTGNPPWHFTDDKGAMAGFDVALGHLVAQALFNDVSKVQFQVQGADARVPSLLTDKVDLCIQFMTITGPRAQQVEFTTPYYREGVGLLMPKNSRFRDFNGLLAAGAAVKASVIQNAFAEQQVHDGLPKAQVVQLDSIANVIQAVDSGRADVACVGSGQIRWLSTRYFDKYKDAGHYWFGNLYAAAVKPGDPVWLNFVNTVLEDAMGGLGWPYYQQNYKTYFGINLPSPPIGFPIEVRMDQALGLIRTQ